MSGRCQSSLGESAGCGSYLRATQLSLSWILPQLWQGEATRILRRGGDCKAWGLGLPEAGKVVPSNLPVKFTRK